MSFILESANNQGKEQHERYKKQWLTKGKVERLVRFVKEIFLLDRVFWNITDLNRAALEWCEQQNHTYHRVTDGVPNTEQLQACARVAQELVFTLEFLFYLCPERKISFDGFVNFEGHRFGVPFHCRGPTAIYIYSSDMKQLLTSHDMTWSKRDRYCSDQCVALQQSEEFPTMPVKTEIVRLPESAPNLSFDKFNFDKEVEWYE